MSEILVRVPLSGQTDFHPLALAPGLPMLDARKLTYQVLLGWFGDVLAEPELDEDGVIFHAQTSGQRRTIFERALATERDLNGSLSDDYERLKKALFDVRPVSPSERLIFNRLQPPIGNYEGLLYRVRLEDGEDRLLWCWGFQRRAGTNKTLLCPNDACSLLFTLQDESMDSCPRCGESFLQKALGQRRSQIPYGAIAAATLLGAICAGTYWIAAGASDDGGEVISELAALEQPLGPGTAVDDTVANDASGVEPASVNVANPDAAAQPPGDASAQPFKTVQIVAPAVIDDPLAPNQIAVADRGPIVEDPFLPTQTIQNESPSLLNPDELEPLSSNFDPPIDLETPSIEPDDKTYTTATSPTATSPTAASPTLVPEIVDPEGVESSPATPKTRSATAGSKTDASATVQLPVVLPTPVANATGLAPLPPVTDDPADSEADSDAKLKVGKKLVGTNTGNSEPSGRPSLGTGATGRTRNGSGTPDQEVADRGAAGNTTNVKITPLIPEGTQAGVNNDPKSNEPVQLSLDLDPNATDPIVTPTRERLIGELKWHEDYLAAYQEATEQRKPLLMVFTDPAEPNSSESLARDFAEPKLDSLLDGFVRVTMPINTAAPSQAPGEFPTLLLEHRSFRHLSIRSGIVIVDLTAPDSGNYGRVVSALAAPENGRYSAETLRSLLELPTGTISQRTFLLTLRSSMPDSVFSRAPFSTELNALANRNARFMAHYEQVGAYEVSERAAAVAQRFGADAKLRELLFASEPGVTLQEASMQAVQNWLENEQDFPGVSNSGTAFGIELFQSPTSSRWFATCLIVESTQSISASR